MKMLNEDDMGYYCLLIAILCDLNVEESKKMYKYGPNHPLCKKIMGKKVRIEVTQKMDKKQMGKYMKELREAGYSYEAIAEAFSCYPSAVRRRIKTVEDNENR